MLLMIDNYDSFTYNLVQYFGELGEEVLTIRNDEITLDDIKKLNPERICLSPGPCSPKEAGICVDLLKEFSGKLPILGVCLGHQCVGYTYGGTVGYAGEIMHGKTSMIRHNGKGVLKGLPDPFEAIRYHSLAVYRDDLPEELEVTAWTDKGIIMGVRHRTHPVVGVQFHPESIMTKVGHDLLRNFLEM